MYDEFARLVLEEIAAYFGRDEVKEVGTEDVCANDNVPVYKFPAISLDYCRIPTERDRLENLVDTTDGFLMLAFQHFFVEKADVETNMKESMYTR